MALSEIAAPEPRRRVYSVAAVVARADQVLREQAPRAIWVRGEVSNWSRASSGHCYFCLKDDRAELQCVLWRDRASALPALPRDGMEIDALGTIGIYPRKGRFQLDVERLDLTGSAGLWDLAREELIAKLRAEGLLDERRKRPIPALPERIGLVTSHQGAALQDMWRTMRRRAWWIHVSVSACTVEGADAAPDVVRALRRFGTGPGQTPVDLVIVARGGGSRESLWAFNTEAVARAIAACPFPTISAVGHETDYTVADQVADLRAATPTAGAEHATPDGRDLLERFHAYPEQIRLRLDRKVTGLREELERHEHLARRATLRRVQLLGSRLAGVEREAHARAPRERQRRYRERLATLEAAIPHRMHQRLGGARDEMGALERALPDRMERRLEALRHRLARQAAEAEAKSPLRALARGYSLVTDAATGAVVRRPEQAPAGTVLRIRLAGGTLHARAAEADPSPPLAPPLPDAG